MKLVSIGSPAGGQTGHKRVEFNSQRRVTGPPLLYGLEIAMTTHVQRVKLQNGIIKCVSHMLQHKGHDQQRKVIKVQCKHMHFYKLHTKELVKFHYQCILAMALIVVLAKIQSSFSLSPEHE